MGNQLPPPPAHRLSMPIDDRPGSVGSVQRVPRLPADPPGPSQRDAGPASPLDPRECRRPADGYRRWGVLADDLGRSTERMPSRSRAPRSPTTDHAPSHRRYREHVAGQSAGATVDPSRARTLQHAPEPRTLRLRSAGSALRPRSRAAATATDARDRAVTRGAGGTPSAASGPGTARDGERYRRCPPAQTGRRGTRPCSSSHPGSVDDIEPVLGHGSRADDARARGRGQTGASKRRREPDIRARVRLMAEPCRTPPRARSQAERLPAAFGIPALE